MSSIYDVKSTLTQTALDAFCQKCHIHDDVHPELPTPDQSIHDSPVGKIGVYTRFFDFANFRIPLSQFLVDVLKYFRINLSQLSIIAAAKVSHFEILCHVYGYIPTVGLFRRFYVNSKNKGWMSFSKRSDTAPVCYTKSLDSLKHWNDSFFWVDASVFPLSVMWHTKKTLVRDLLPTAAEFSAEACDFLATHQASFRKFLEPFLCLVGLSRYYEFDDDVYPTFLTDAGEEMDLFAFIHHADSSKARIGERQIKEGQVLLLESTEGRVIPLADGNKQGGQNDNAEVAEPHDLNKENGAEVGNQTEESDRVVHDEEDKKEPASGASGSNLPPKILREDHDTSGDVGASTAGKSLAALQDLLDRSTLIAKVGVTAAATVPFVTFSVALTLEHKGGGHTDYVFGPNLRTQHPAKRFVISLDSSHHSSINAADVKVTSIIRSFVPPPPVMTVAVAATVVVGTSSAHIYVPKWNVINDSSLNVPEVCRSMIDQFSPTGFFSQLRGMDYDQQYAEFNVGVARQTCLSAEVRLRSKHNLRERKKFKRKCVMQTDLLK
ncbi:hypothetical protein Tco_0448065 [Tanacetum coccineum]